MNQGMFIAEMSAWSQTAASLSTIQIAVVSDESGRQYVESQSREASNVPARRATPQVVAPKTLTQKTSLHTISLASAIAKGRCHFGRRQALPVGELRYSLNARSSSSNFSSSLIQLSTAPRVGNLKRMAISSPAANAKLIVWRPNIKAIRL